MFAKTTRLFAVLVLTLAPALAHAEAEAQATADARAPVPATANDEPITLGDSAAPPAARGDRPERTVHGEVGVAVGTGGYRSGYLILEAPLGERGEMGIAVGASRSGRSGYPGYAPAVIGPDTLGPPRFGEHCEVIERNGAPPPPDAEPLCGQPGAQP